MNLVEVMVASVLLVTASSCSLQVWAGTSQWVRQAEQRQQQASQLEAALLSSQGQLQGLAGTPVAADCAVAGAWLVAHLQAQPLAAGLSRAVSPEPGALVRVAISGAEGLQRQRWLSPAAYGLCGQAAAQEASDGTL